MGDAGSLSDAGVKPRRLAAKEDQGAPDDVGRFQLHWAEMYSIGVITLSTTLAIIGPRLAHTVWQTTVLQCA